MSDIESRVAGHYGIEGLEQRILDALAANGVDIDRLTPDELAAIDEFHIGGVEATDDLIARLDWPKDAHVLDVGSGIGGPARRVASRTGARVTGIDLTEGYVAIAASLSGRVGLAERTRFVKGSALALPFEPAEFDGAMILHVGMNLPDKTLLMSEVARVVKPGGVFAVYDVMRLADGPIAFPVPWAATEETSFVATRDAYRKAAEAAGFAVEAERERRAFAIDFFERVRARQAEAEAAGRPRPPGVGLVMGADAPLKIANLTAALKGGMLAPVEMILRRS